MDMIHEFKRARPEAEAFTEADADLLWARTFSDLDTAATRSAVRDELPLSNDFDPPAITQNVVSWDSPSRVGRRRFAGLMAAAAAVVAMVFGVAVIQSRQSPPTDTAAGEIPAVDPATTAPGWTEFPHPPIDPRFQYAATATDSGIFVWGGCCADGSGSTFFTDGAYYDAATAEWRELPGAPLDLTRGDAIATWNGSEVLAINGVDGATAAAFDPSSFTWRSVTPPVSETITSGGSQLQPLEDGRIALANDMAVTIWDPKADAWTARVELDGVDRSETSVAWNSRYASTPTTLAVVTSDSSTEAGIDCSAASIQSFDFASSTWSTFGFQTTDWLPTAIIGLDSTSFLLAGGFPCDGQPAGAPRAAIIDTATEAVTWVTSPPTQVDGRRYGPTVAGSAAAFIGTDGRLTVYRPDTDEWSVGPSVLKVGEPNGDLVDDTPLVWLDDRIVIVSTGYGQSSGSGGWTCCFPTANAWQTPLPTGIDPTLQPPVVAEAAPSTTEPTAVQPTQEYWLAVWDAREIVIGDCMQQLGHEYRPRPNDAARPTNESVGTWDDWNQWRSGQASGDPSFEADLLGSDLDAQAGGCQLDAYLAVHGPGEEAYSKAAGLENQLRADLGSADLDQPDVDRWVEAHEKEVASVRAELDEELVNARSIIEGAGT